MSEKENPKYMTTRECREISGKIQLALFGKDGRGGMVKDISDLTNDVKDIKDALTEAKKTEKQKTELSNKWKITIYGSAITSFSLVVVEAIKLIAQALG